MAKRIIPDYYQFDPINKRITIPNRVFQRQQLLLVVNESSNTVLFNFSDPDLYATSYTAPYSSSATSIGTQFTLAYNTTAMGTADTISIMMDEVSEFLASTEVLQDPTNKLRTASPQSLIDTDFEYGLQPIKWEAFTTLSNYPSYYLKSGGNSLNVAALVANGANPYSIATLNTGAFAHNLSTGDLVSIQYSGQYLANGVFPVTNVLSSGSVQFRLKGSVTGTLVSSYTQVQGGSLFDSNNQTSLLALATNQGLSFTTLTLDALGGGGSGATILVNTAYKHGLNPGSPILVNSSATTTANGVWFVYDVPTPTSFRYQTPGFAAGSSSAIIDTSVIVVAPRPEANFVHRAPDGGIMIASQNLQHGIAGVRQTRRYFRYQSGKGIQLSTGTKFAPNFEIAGVSSIGTTAVLTIAEAVTIGSGCTIQVEGVKVNAGTTDYYNGTFLVRDVYQSSQIVTYTMAGTPTDKFPGANPTPYATVKNWQGAVSRVGMFDAQNGFYVEYDGTSWYVVRRSSVRELMGQATVTNGSQIITSSTPGLLTKFSKQLNPGDYIVIRGQSYLVTTIDSDTQIQVNPAYRGATATNVRISLTQNLKVPQSSWNIDRCDGTGPTGYVLDATKMQMVYIDYTWYGAGHIRWGFRTTDGNVTYVHKMQNNNVNNVAYMRSGNLPARYEVNNVGPCTQLVGNNTTSVGGAFLAAQTDTLLIRDGIAFPTSGTVILQQLTTSVEVINYTAKTAVSISGDTYYALTGLSRRQLGGSTSNSTFFPTEFFGGTAGFSSVCSVNLITCNCAPIIMHWGSSVIMDGGYDDDRSIAFAYTKQGAGLNVPANTSIALLSIRLAPSADNSQTGAMGIKDIVNRMQLQTRSLGIATNTSVQILGVLNPSFPASATKPSFPGDWATTSLVQSIGTGSLAQIIDHTGTTTIIQGGEQIFGFVTGNSADNYDISRVRDLGTSILSGDGSNKTPGFPNGPDVLTIVIRNSGGAPAQVNNIRLSWTEAQA